MYNKIFDAVDSKTYYSKIFGVLPEETSTGNVLVKCPFHDDRESSLALNVRDRGGLFYCHGCGASGNLVEFHRRYKGIDTLEATVQDLVDLVGVDVKTFSADFLDDSNLPKFHSDLLENEKFLNHLKDYRGLTDEGINRFELGIETRTVDGRSITRVTIPIRDAQNKLVNIRRWLPEFERKVKQDSARKVIGMPGFNTNHLFPISALQQQTIIICEGEMDCLLLCSHRFNAVTATAGAQNFNKSWYRLFNDKDIILLFDNDQEGRKGAEKLLTRLYDYARSIRIIELAPDLNDKDITDVWRDTKNDFECYLKDLINSTTPYNKPSDLEMNAVEVNLYQAAREDLIGKKIRVRALVNGKEDRPYAIPKRISLTCNAKKKGCPNCPGVISDGTLEKVIPPQSPYVLQLLFSSRSQQIPIYREIFSVYCKVSNAFKVLEDQNVEEIRLIPDMDMGSDTVSYIIRQAYFVGYGLDYNEVYDFTGVTTIDPRNNAVTHVFWKAERVHNTRDNLNIAEEVECDGVVAPVRDHLKIFQPAKEQTVFSKLNEIYNDLEFNVTGIVKRKDIIQVIDLTYHSPVAFTLGNEFEKKGWMDTLIIGDTHCGKTRTMRTLRDHYNAGEVYDGTHISVVGIVGGYIAITGSNRTRYVLGVWPLNDGRLVCIDELSGLNSEAIGQLTSVRSEGIAESTKQGQRNRYPARVRFICLSNPRNNRAVQDYSYGCMAIRELIGEDADISRYDIAIIVAGNEVTHEEINSKHSINVPHIYTSDLCSLMIRWAWSRKPSNIRFTDKAVNLIMQASKDMGENYDPSIPLVLGQSQRKKIARISTAIATRLFNSPDGETVLVETDHVEAALKMLDEFYSKPCMGYHLYSASCRRENSLPNEKGVKSMLDTASYMLYEFLLSSRTGTITKNDLVEYSGEHTIIVDKLFKDLIRYRCIAKKGRYYKCTPAFITFLKNYNHPRKDDYFIDGKSLVDETDVDLE